MITLPGYDLAETLSTSSNSVIYRARRHVDGHPVVLKVLRDPAPSPERLSWFRREFELARSLALPGVIPVLDLEHYPPHWVLVMDDFGGESLNRLVLMGTISLSAFLRIALDITNALGQIHQQQIVHRDINPSNIIYNASTGQIKLIDFGLASRLSREAIPFHAPHGLEGTLAYLAPEQTGRMNRTVDYRSDFYALGATFYELLTGQVPFISEDPLELIHSHIARAPTPPHHLRPTIPEAVSTIILKLLAKDPDERYQSIAGLKIDLEECLHQLETTGIITPFPLGQRDVSDRFKLPQKLYGRKQELAKMLATFDRVAQGERALLLVTGAPGIGKTALVEELHTSITRRRGTLITGKFDQVQRSTPYLAFTRAFRALIHRLLTEPEEKLARWHTRLQEALGVNGQVMVDIIPDLELIIGPQPPVPELGPQEAQNRFHLAFQNLLRVFTRPEQPLVLFLDDLQWIDSASLRLLEQMLFEGASQYLLVIGAYRTNEALPDHPLQITLDALRLAGLPTTAVQLEGLQESALQQMLAEILHSTAEEAHALAAVLLTKTGGNPFFLGQFLKSLVAEEVLTFDALRRCWVWELERVEARQMTDNMVELLTEQVGQLPGETQLVLQAAACIGSRFDLTTLTAITEQTPATLAQQLEPAIGAGLIELVDESYQGAAGAENFETTQFEYRFTHNRVLQVAYLQVPADQRVLYHWYIGQRRLEDTPREMREERLFDIVSQLNQGHVLVANDEQRQELAQLNLEAGRKARLSAAYATAYEYLGIGLALLPGDAWQRYYGLTLALHEDAAEAAYLSGDFEAMERLMEVVLQQAHSVLDTVKAYEARILGTIARSQFLEAIQIELTLLRQLGIDLPEQPAPADIGAALQEVQTTLGGRSIEDLLDLPLMTEPSSRAAMRILSLFASSTYGAALLLFPITMCKMVVLSMQAGNASESPFAYAVYGLLLCGIVGDIEAGYRAGNLAVQLVDRIQARAVQTKVHLVFNLHIRNWKEHPAVARPNLQHNYRVGLETGDPEYACHSAFNYCCLGLLSNTDLDHLLQDLALYHKVIVDLKQPAIARWQAMLWQVVQNLREPASEPGMISGEIYAEQQMLPEHQASNDGFGLFCYYLYKLMLAYLFEEEGERLKSYAAMVEPYAASAAANPSTAMMHFYTALARLRLLPQSPPDQQAALLEQITFSQQQLQTWAQHAPMNFLHKWYLIEAERCRVQGRHGDAREYYDQAIAGAREQGYLLEEALANELAGRFYLQKAHFRIAHLYLRDAHSTYQRWGALSRMHHLENQYPEVFAGPLPTTDRHSITSTSRLSTLDVDSIFKAIQTISSEIQLEAFLSRLMQVLLETAGAERGVLVLRRANSWRVEAEGRIEPQAIIVLQALPLEESAVPLSLLSYVQRTRETVVLHDAPSEGAFTQDPYVQSQRPRSLLCLPLLYRGEVTGLLYLENRLASGAFTANRLEILALISGHVATSLENAHLYTSMEALVAERTRELAMVQQQVIDAQQQAIEELSTPLIPISDSVVIMPLIGTIDAQRAQQVMETLLEGVSSQRAAIAILDITGVRVVDTQIANALIQSAHAVRLLGAQVVLTGIRPDVAQTLVHLGIDLSTMITRSTLQAGIAHALQQTRHQQPGRKVVKLSPVP